MIRGREKAPVKKTRKALREYGVKVVKIDEHRSSQLCSACKTHDVANVKYEERVATKSSAAETASARLFGNAT